MTLRLTSKLITGGLLATLACASVSPALADRAGTQADKNTMRNLALGGAAVAVYGLLNHNNTATLLGAAGAALAGSQYEKDRRQQSQDSDRRYYRDERDRGRGDRDRDQYRDRRWHGDDSARWRGDHRDGRR